MDKQERVERRGSQRLRLFKRLTASTPLSATSANELSLQVFSGSVYIMDVSYHGCLALFPLSVKTGTMLELFSPESKVRTVMASVIWCAPLTAEMVTPRWKIGLEFVTPGNHWNIDPPPRDWIAAQAPRESKLADWLRQAAKAKSEESED